MNYNEILSILAPCGLNCIKCVGHEKGRVREHAAALHELLDGFDSYAERFSSYVPAFGKYPSFKEVLDLLAGCDCAGCRGNESKYPHCSIARCHKDKGFDFCFQCSDYPCSPAGLYPELIERWRSINDRMREIGVEAYY